MKILCQISIAVLLLCLSLRLFADENNYSGMSYVKDSNTDRKPLLTAFPDYPSIARRDRIEGEATVCFKIDAYGNIKRASVAEYTDKIFRKPALRAVRKSSFEALSPGQVMATAKTCRTYRFRLEPVIDEEAEDQESVSVMVPDND